MNKILMSACAILAVAGIGLFLLLLESREENGQLEADLATAEEVNQGNLATIEVLKQAAADAVARAAHERKLADQAAHNLEENLTALGLAQDELAIRIANSKKELTDEDLLCADRPVPDVLLNSLRADQRRDADGGGGGPEG